MPLMTCLSRQITSCQCVTPMSAINEGNDFWQVAADKKASQRVLGIRFMADCVNFAIVLFERILLAG